MGAPLERNFTAPLDCHYLLQVPDRVDEGALLIVTLHGFGGKPYAMLNLTEQLLNAPAVIAALQGPNQFFMSPDVRNVGYGWITNQRPEESIRLHHRMVQQVLDEVGREFAVPVGRRVLVGFSQSVALNYRFSAACPEAVRGVVAICGGMPGDWGEDSGQRIQASVLHIATRQDEYYPPSVTEPYEERLRNHAADVEFHLVDGGHRIPGNAVEIVGPWLRRTCL